MPSSAAEAAFQQGEQGSAPVNTAPAPEPTSQGPVMEPKEQNQGAKSAAEAAFAAGESQAAPEASSSDSTFQQRITATPYDKLSQQDKQRVESITDPEDLKAVPKHIPLNDMQLRTKFEAERALPWNQGMRTMEDWYNIGNDVVGSAISFAKGAKKFAQNSLFAGADEDPEGWGHPSMQPLKDAMSSVAELPELAAYTATKLKEGGLDWYDRASEALGAHDQEKSFENYKARHLVDQVHADQIIQNPSIYSRILKGDLANKALSAVVLNTLPDTQTIMQQDGITKEQAATKRQLMADQIAKQTTDEIADQEKPADKDIATFGQFASGALGMGDMAPVMLGTEAVAGLSPVIAQGLKYLGKNDAEIKAMNDAAQALSRSKVFANYEKAAQPSMLGRAAGATATGLENLGNAYEKATEGSPQILKDLAPMVIGGAIGYETDPENRGLGALLGAGLGHGVSPALSLGKHILKLPALVRDVEDARVLSGGGTRGTFETLGSFPDVSPTTAKILRYGGKQVDDLIDNTVEYAKQGINPVLVGVASGALNSDDPEQMNQMISQGILYGVGGRALHHAWGKITGTDPILEQRQRRQQAVDDWKTYKSLDPETQKTVDGLSSWDNIVNLHQNKVAETQQQYRDAVGRGNEKLAADLGRKLIVQKQVLSAVMRANVQTRAEYNRTFLKQLTQTNNLVNGSLRAGQNNVGIHILTPDQIYAKFRADKANDSTSDAEIRETAAQQGFYSTPEGAVEYRAGMPMDGVKNPLIFDRTKPSVVINADHLKARMAIFGETPTEALNHEIGHHVANIPEFREANKDAAAMLFSQEIKDLTGKVTATTSGQYSPKDLVQMYETNYMAGKTPEQVEQLSTLAGLWDRSRGKLNEDAVAAYMRDEIIADLNAETLSKHLGNLDNASLKVMDTARLKTKKNILDKAVQKVLGLGGEWNATSELTGATFSPEVLAANRNAMRALKDLQGEVSPAVKAPDAPKISRAEMMKNRAIMERYGKYSGLFKTKMQAQVFDAQGNAVGAPLDIINPAAAEGAWERRNGNTTQLNGYGQQPDEAKGLNIPEGGRLVVGRQIVTQPDGVTPVMLDPKEAKKLQRSRIDAIRQALDTPDHGAPNRFEPVSDDSTTYRGTFTPLQIQAIKDLPEGIVPRSIKANMLKINDMIVKGDGSRLLADYAAVMNDNGKYNAYSPKIYDVVPIGMHLSKDGNFLATVVSVGRMFDKLNAWSERMPARLSPWGGSKDAFFKEFTDKYLKNWQNGVAGETGLDPNPTVALAKKNIFNDFLNLTNNDFRGLNEDRTTTPRRRGDARAKNIDRTIMSMRLDHIAELIDHSNAPKVPIDYGKAIRNFMPESGLPHQERPEEGEEAVKPTIYYHGTTRPEGEEGKLNNLGLVFVSPDKEEASMYSKAKGGRVLQTDITGKKIFDAENPEDLKSIGATDEDRLWDSRYIENEDWIKKIKDAGYDGFHVQDVSVGGLYGITRGAKNVALFETPKFTFTTKGEQPALTPSILQGITAVHVPAGSPQQPAPKTGIQFMPASMEIREKGTPQHLEFFNRELENSGIKDKPATMDALDKWIHSHVKEKYRQSNLNAPAQENKLFPRVDPEKIKNYYQKAVRNATPEQAADFPPDWLRIRNMSQEEFDRSFDQDKVDKITQFRVNALAQSANYLLGEMKQPQQTELQKKIIEINDAFASGDIGLWEEKQAELERLNGDTYENLRNEAFRGSYTPSEVAAILNASSKFRINAGYNEEGEMVPLIQNISNGNEAVPNEVSGATASKIAEYMRQGMSSKDAYAKGVFDVIQARAQKRGVFTGWKKYDQSSDMGDAETLNADCAGTGWCTGGAVGTANSHLSGGDFYLYFDNGEPQVAIRTENGHIAEVRGTEKSTQRITKPEYDTEAERFIRSGEGPQGGEEYLHDRNFRKMAIQIMKEGKLPEEAYKYYDQDGNFMAPKPKQIDYGNGFEPEYIQPFKQYAPKPEDVFEIETQASRDRAQGISFMPSSEEEPERITEATYTNPRTGEVTRGATHRIANPSAPQEATDRESPAYGFATDKGRIVDRKEAYNIANDSGQLKTPATEEEKFHADRGVLHSDMVNYEGKSDLSFMPSKLDEAHAKAIESGDTEEAQRLVDEAARKAGYTIGPVYHGTPTGGFNVFHEQPTYFAPEKENADIYKSSTASSIRVTGTKEGQSETKKVYLKANNVFDTRNPENKRIFEKEFLGKSGEEWGSNGTPLQDSGLPDWTDGRDLVDWITEEKKPYDAIVLDEGGLPQPDGSIRKKGSSVVVWKPAQIKSADPATYDHQGNLIPLSQRFDTSKQDIRFMPKSEEEPKNLVAVHNTSAEKIANALKIGGFAVPSVAIIRNDRSQFDSFGDITLVAPKGLINPEEEKKSKVFNADVYSPRYPSVSYSITDRKAAKSLRDSLVSAMDKMPEDLRKKFFVSFESEQADKPMLKRFSEEPIFMAAFLSDTGRIKDVPFSKVEDRYEQQSAKWDVREYINSNPELKDEFNNWLAKTLKDSGVTEEEKLFAGYTPSGNRRYLPHTIENVVKMMTKSIRDGEGFNYGVGSIRSKAAKQFRTMKGIEASRESIIPKEEMERLKDEVNNEFENIVQESAKQRANQGRGGFVMDAISDDIKAFAEGGAENMKYLREMYPDGAPYQLWRDYLEKLRGLPTEYFEAKVQRGVDLNEFAGAVVPKGTSQELINKLEKKGLEVITYPKGDKMARAEAVKSISGKRSDIAFMPEGKTKEEEPIDWTAFTQKTEKPLSTIRAYAVPQQQKDESY